MKIWSLINLDTEKNKSDLRTIRTINKEDSQAKILVIPTNEELEIAKQSVDLIKN